MLNQTRLDLLRRAAACFPRERRGVSAVEFALLAPVLVIMLGGAVELSGAITTANRSTYVADALAEMVSRVDHTITEDEMKNFALSAALIDTDVVRYAKTSGKSVENAFKITVTSVQFKPKALDCLLFACKYDAEVVFSYSMNGTARSCGTLTGSAADKQSAATLPTGVFGPGSLVVIDVETFYAPVMPVRLGEEIGFKRSSYFRPRYLSRVNYVKNCPNYS